MLLAGCGPDVVSHEPFEFGGESSLGGGGDTDDDDDGDDGDDDDDDDDDAESDGGEGDAGDDGTGPGDPDPTTGGDDETGDPVEPACDIYEQDCAAGEKCTIYANGGGVLPNDVRCVPVIDVGQDGDACTRSLDQDGVDDCDVGLYCQVDDPSVDTAGSCVSYCEGFSGNGNCEDPDMECALLFGGVAPVCLPACTSTDECPGGQSCQPQMIGDAVCVGDAWGA